MNHDISALAYVAGFVDGEGCLMINANGSVSLTIVNTSIRALQFVKSVLGVGTIDHRKQRVNKAQWVYRAYGDDCICAVEKIMPFLIDKTEQAELLLEYRKIPKTIRIPGRRGAFATNTREEYITKMRELKKYEQLPDLRAELSGADYYAQDI